MIFRSIWIWQRRSLRQQSMPITTSRAHKNFPAETNKAMRKVWFAYGDLGYDGINGKRAKQVIDNLKIIIELFEKRFEVKIYEENTQENSKRAFHA